MAFQAGVVVGYQRDVEEAHLQLARERDLRVLRHVDDVPSVGREPFALGPRGKARSLNDDHSATRMDCNAKLTGRFYGQGTEHGAVRICGADVDDFGSLIEKG